jgi:ketosteroid isomerase-like protein
MALSAAERDQLFKSFARAFFRRDVDALYQTVAPEFSWHTVDEAGEAHVLSGREAISKQLAKRSDRLENVRFEDVVYHHAPEATFMTFRLTATDKTTGRAHEEIGVERYTFKDGLILTKDVYRKPVAQT